MDKFRNADLIRLVQADQGPCVTIMMPTHCSGPDAEQDALRLKNLADQAQELLANGWLRACHARDWLLRVRQCVSDKEFWDRRSLGLAFFLKADSLESYRVPVALEELAIVNQRFYIKPLIRLATENQRFLLLAVSQHHAALYEATRFEIQRIDVPGLPQRIEDALDIEGADRGQQQHLANRFGKGKQTSVFHGQGGTRDTHKDELGLYFNQIDQALSSTLMEYRIPLVLAGVDYLLPILRRTLDYPHLLGAELHGNFDHTMRNELLQKAWPLVEPTLLKEQEFAAEKFQNLSNTDLVTADPQDSIKASFDGRVDTLFVDVNEHLWGLCDAYGQVSATHTQVQPGDEDLLDNAVAQTILHGGKVFALSAEQMPCNQPIAALLRY